MKYSTVSLSLLCLSLPSLVTSVVLAQPAASAGTASSAAHPATTVTAATPTARPAVPVVPAPGIPTPVSAAPVKLAPAPSSAPLPAAHVPATPGSVAPKTSEPSLAVQIQPAAPQPEALPAGAAPSVPASDAPSAVPQISNPWQPIPAKPKVEEPPPQPIQQWGELHLGFSSVLNRDSGYDLFSDNDAWRSFVVALEADLIELSPETRLGLQLGYAYGSTDNGTVPSQVGVVASLYSHQPHAGVLFKWKATNWFSVHARAHAGYSFSKLNIERGSLGQAVSVSQSSPFAGVGAGVNFTSPALRIAKNRDFLNGLSLGARIEGGYSFAKAIEASFPDQAASPPERRIPLRGADLGTLERSGPYLYLGGFVRF